MKLVVEQARRGISGAVPFGGKLSPFYSSGLAKQRGCSESGWKRGKRLGWSDAEAAENRARRLIAAQEGLWRTGTPLAHNQLLFGRFGHERCCSA